MRVNDHCRVTGIAAKYVTMATVIPNSAGPISHGVFNMNRQTVVETMPATIDATA